MTVDGVERSVLPSTAPTAAAPSPALRAMALVLVVAPAVLLGLTVAEPQPWPIRVSLVLLTLSALTARLGAERGHVRPAGWLVASAPAVVGVVDLLVRAGPQGPGSLWLVVAVFAAGTLLGPAVATGFGITALVVVSASTLLAGSALPTLDRSTNAELVLTVAVTAAFAVLSARQLRFVAHTLSREEAALRRANNKLRRRADQQAELARLSHLVLAEREVDIALESVVRRLETTVGAPRISVLLEGTSNVTHSMARIESVTDDQALLGALRDACARAGAQPIAPDSPLHALLTVDPRESVVVAPVRSEAGRGLVVAAFARGQTHDEVDRYFLEGVAHLLTAALERSRSEQRARTAEAELAEQRVAAAERHAELDRQLLAARRLEAIGQLAGGVAHDFNNLLTIILANAELLRGESLSARAAQSVHEIHEGGERAAQLTAQLLAFARRQRSEPKPVDVTDVVRSMRGILERIVRENVRVELALGETPLTALADRSQLEQVVLNLVANARDAMPNGGSVQVEAMEARGSEDGTLSDGRWVCLQVRDTGHGMSAEVRARLFEPFFTTKGVGAGTGLGLATVYGIVKQSGGHIEVASEVGAGSTFRVYFPSAEPATIATQTARAPTKATTGRTILLVDDEPSVRRVLQEVLTRAGHRVLAASDGEVALNVAEDHEGPLDVLVTDLVMPRLGGIDLARRLIVRRPNIRVLFVSGYADELPDPEELGRPIELLSKPFPPQVLVARLEDLLRAE